MIVITILTMACMQGPITTQSFATTLRQARGDSIPAWLHTPVSVEGSSVQALARWGRRLCRLGGWEAQGGPLRWGDEDFLLGIGLGDSAPTEEPGQLGHELVEITGVDVGAPVDELAGEKERAAEPEPDAQTGLGESVLAGVLVDEALIDGPLDDITIGGMNDHGLSVLLVGRHRAGRGDKVRRHIVKTGAGPKADAS